MSNERILVVEDEPDIQELVRYNLEREGYRVEGRSDGESGLEAARSVRPDLVVLDLMLPGLDGLDVCKAIRSDVNILDLPIIMLTAKGEESDIVLGLELGADDYVTKPFRPKVLIARIRAILRRRAEKPADDSKVIRHADLTIHPGRHEVRLGDASIHLTSSEFAILQYLALRPGWVFTRNQIVDKVHGYDYPVTERSVDVQIAGLRKKLGGAGKCIETVRGVGYRFKE